MRREGPYVCREWGEPRLDAVFLFFLYRYTVNSIHCLVELKNFTQLPHTDDM